MEKIKARYVVYLFWTVGFIMVDFFVGRSVGFGLRSNTSV